jgi:hypothetical protein
MNLRRVPTIVDADGRQQEEMQVQHIFIDVFDNGLQAIAMFQL